jgi:two-component system, NarL family, response regulator NreC
VTKLRILLADDHGVLRAGLRSFLDSQADMIVVAAAETAEDAVLMARESEPDLAMLDVRMPGGGLTAARVLHEELPKIRVLVLSQYDDSAYLRAALAAGAAGYALKRSPGPELLQAIRAIARGEVYLHPAMARVLVQESWGPRDAPAAPQVLSERETQVLRLTALGYTTEQIAEQLFLSVRTVETYKLRCTDKLGLRGRAALVRYALDNGLLETETDT